MNLFPNNKKKNDYKKRYFYIETYGCQMNISDSEIVSSILNENGFIFTNNILKSDLLLINTCSIREKAEISIKNRLKYFNSIKKKKPNIIIIFLGCMAERLKKKLLDDEKLVDIVVGPDSYRDIPRLINLLDVKKKRSINVLLSREETYADITPLRLLSNKVSSLITIMRGCDNMCTFCVVPFTRGRERSRDPYTILNECEDVYKKGYKEIILLGQNVDSYKWKNNNKKNENLKIFTFSKLLKLLARSFPNLRIRFSTSNPHDMTKDVLFTINKYSNICKHIHLPFQSGSNSILKKMNRKYTKEDYIDLINNIRSIIPNCSISHDTIVGFCGETDKDHNDTIKLMKYVKYDYGYMFYYSPRPNTIAYRKFKDDVPFSIKKKRLSEVIKLQRKHSYYRMLNYLQTYQEILIEGLSKKNEEFFFGRNSQNVVAVFPKNNKSVGEIVNVKVTSCTSATLIGKIV